MNSTGFGRRGWLMQLVAFLVLFVGVASAHAWNINGTVTNSVAATRSGRVYLYLQQQYGGDTGLGLSIQAPTPGTPFQIRGVPNGTYTLNAFVDGSGTGRIHPADPTWNSPGAITISGSDHTLDSTTTVNFTTAPSVSPVAPSKAQILPGDNGAFVGWNEPTDTNGNTIADSYKVYYSTVSTTPRTNPQGVITVPAGDQAFALFHYANGTTLNVQVTALIGATESAPTAVASTTINPPAPGFTISGTIDTSAITSPTGNLYIALVDKTNKGGPVAVAYVANPPQSSNNFTITTNSTKVPNGTYSLFALIDMNSDGKIASGDVMPSEQQAPTVSVSGSNLPGQTVTLTKSNSVPFINTTHYQDSNTPPNEGYNVVLGAQAKTEVLTNITVNSGPNNGLSYPIDLGLTSSGQFQAWLNVNNNRPQPTDAYNLTIKYAGGVAADTLNLNPTVVLDSFATSLAPAGSFPYASITNPATTNFTWGAPTTPPTLTPYTYSLWATIPGFPSNGNQYSNMPSSTLSQSVSGLTYSDGAFNTWTVSVQDAAGNQAQKSATLTYTSAPTITSFSPPTVLQGDTVTINGTGFNTTAGNNNVIFGCGAQATAATATTTQLTVVVPSNACTFFLQVQDTSTGKTSQNSNAQLNVLQTMTVSGQVTDASTNSGINSASVTANFTLNSTPHTVSTTTNFGNYNLPGIPQNTDFTLSFSATSYASAYSGTINTNQSFMTQNMVLYPTASFTAWNSGDTTTGVIRGRVFDQATFSGISGVTVSPAPGFTVQYDDGSGNTPGSGTSTSSNGIFYITHVTNLASVTVTATKAGYLITPITVVGHTNSITSIDMPAFPIISISGKITNSANANLAGVTISQVGTSNTAISAADGTFTFNNLPGGSTFELMMSLTGYVPTYTGPLNFPSSVTLPFPVVLYTTAEFASTGITPGKGAIIGRVVNMNNPVATISGMRVMPSPKYTVNYFDQIYNSGAGGFNPAAAETDATGIFLVSNVDDLASVSINTDNSPIFTIGGNMFLTTHGNAISEIMVPCNVPTPFGWLTSPSAITVATSVQTPNINAQVNMGNATLVPGPAAGLLVELGYGPLGTDPTSLSWIWKTAPYSGQNGGNHNYITNLSVTTPGSYDYTYRVSYFGGPYVYGDLNGSNDAYSSANAGKLTVTPPLTSTTTTLVSTSNPSIYGQGVGFTATVSPSSATGTVQLYVDGNLVASSNVTAGVATFGSVTNIPVGVHTITAGYSGDSSYAVSTSVGLAQTVNDGIKIGSTGDFLTLQAAIDAALDTNTLLLRGIRFAEDLVVTETLSRPAPFTITLKGGLTSDFVTASTTATSVRLLRIQKGRVNVSGLVIQ